jgi:hypothetical protein
VPVQQEAPTCVYYWVKLITKYDSAKNSRGSFTSIDKHLGISSMNMLELEEEESIKIHRTSNELFRERDRKWRAS